MCMNQRLQNILEMCQCLATSQMISATLISYEELDQVTLRAAEQQMTISAAFSKLPWKHAKGTNCPPKNNFGRKPQLFVIKYIPNLKPLHFIPYLWGRKTDLWRTGYYWGDVTAFIILVFSFNYLDSMELYITIQGKSASSLHFFQTELQAHCKKRDLQPDLIKMTLNLFKHCWSLVSLAEVFICLSETLVTWEISLSV